MKKIIAILAIIASVVFGRTAATGAATFPGLVHNGKVKSLDRGHQVLAKFYLKHNAFCSISTKQNTVFNNTQKLYNFYYVKYILRNQILFGKLKLRHIPYLVCTTLLNCGNQRVTNQTAASGFMSVIV